MGKGIIIDERAAGRYVVRLEYAGRDGIEFKIQALNTRIAARQAEYDLMPEETLDQQWSKAIARMVIAAMVRERQYLESGMPADPTHEIFCADLTTGLTGEVGIIEVPGELDADKLNIRPGYAGAAYSRATDGQLLPAIASNPWSVFLYKCLLPGWQKFKPTYRYGVIVADSINFTADTCDICLNPEYSSQLNLDVNRNQGFSTCEAEAPGGFEQFCSDNPAHPMCTNTTVPTARHISDSDYALIQSINSQVNSEHEYKTDQSGYGVGEHWAIMGPGDTGDCEDYALTKAQALIDAGFPVSNLQMGWGYTETGGAHAFLLIQTTNRGTLVLDNRYDSVMNLDNVPYRIEGYQSAGQSWAGFSSRLTAVPIVYMNCNASAFADGDEVIVQFTGQDWSSPRVIGFRQYPRACSVTAYYLSPRRFGGNIYNMVLDTETWEWATMGVMPSPYDKRFRMGAALVGSTMILATGMFYDSNDVFGYPAADRKHAIIDLTQTYIYGSFATKQAAINPREALTGFGYSGSAYFAGGVRIFLTHYKGDINSSSGYVGCPPIVFTGILCSEDSYQEFYTPVTPYSDTDAFNVLANAWSNKQAMSSPRGLAKGFGIDHELFVVGGVDGYHTVHTTCICCVQVYLYGPPIYSGETSAHTQIVDLVLYAVKYNAVTDAWASITGIGYGVAGYASAVLDGRGYIFSGTVFADITGSDFFYELDGLESDIDFGVPGSQSACDYSSPWQIYSSMSAKEYNPISGSWRTLRDIPNNGLEGYSRDHKGTGLSWTNEAMPAVATKLGTIIVSGELNGGITDDSLHEYSVSGDAYTVRASVAQMKTVTGGLYGLGEVGFSL